MNLIFLDTCYEYCSQPCQYKIKEYKIKVYKYTI